MKQRGITMTLLRYVLSANASWCTWQMRVRAPAGVTNADNALTIIFKCAQKCMSGTTKMLLAKILHSKMCGRRK